MIMFALLNDITFCGRNESCATFQFVLLIAPEITDATNRIVETKNITTTPDAGPAIFGHRHSVRNTS